MIKYFSILFVFISLIGCNPENDPTEDLDQSVLLKNVGENIILPGYEAFVNSTNDLKLEEEIFTANPSEANLNSLRTKWANSYTEWQKVGFFNFGPAETNGLLTVNYYPTNIALLQDYISSGNYNLSAASSTFVKGFPALDYLLFGVANSDTEIISFYTNTTSATEYLSAVVADINDLSKTVRDQWAADYLETFTNNTGTSAGSSLSLVVNSLIQYIELHVRNGKVGIPNGNSVVTDQRLGPFPEKTEGYYSEIYSLGLLKTSLESIREYYIGGNGEGLHDYLVKLDAQDGTLATDFLAILDNTLSKIGNLNNDYQAEIINNGTAVTEVFNNLKTMVALLKVDIVSAISISITYADNDGD